LVLFFLVLGVGLVIKPPSALPNPLSSGWLLLLEELLDLPEELEELLPEEELLDLPEEELEVLLPEEDPEVPLPLPPVPPP
jgi:hypothetical protein